MNVAYDIDALTDELVRFPPSKPAIVRERSISLIGTPNEVHPFMMVRLNCRGSPTTTSGQSLMGKITGAIEHFGVGIT